MNRQIFLRTTMAMGTILGSVMAGSPATAQIEGFTEPYRTSDVAATESGVIVRIQVREGDTVKEGQELARLDHDLHLATLKIAEQAQQSRGALEFARVEQQLHRQRLTKLEPLLAEGHARPEEIERARADIAMAEAKIRTAEDELLLKKLEFERAQVQVERRTVRAPAEGIISHLVKNPGEFVSPSDPRILTLVQLDPLLAIFPVTSLQAATLKPGQTVQVRIEGQTKNSAGTIETISPVIDAESGTIRVKVRLPNPRSVCRSGERCTLLTAP
jgi:membrane fusion protein, multidrug efflux system